MPIYALGGLEPDIDASAFVHPDAVIIGRVRIGAEASVWPGAVLRGDHGRIEIGPRTSIQDGTVVHCTHDWPTLIGAECVVGHNAHLEGCVVEGRCLIGSGSVTLNRAHIGAGAIVAAAALIPEGFEVPSRALAAGVPAAIKRTGLPGDVAARAVKTYLESAGPVPVRAAPPGPVNHAMIDGLAVVDAHVHVPRLSTVLPSWMEWAVTFGQGSGWQDAFDDAGDPDPARLDALLDAEGVDTVLLFAEYSPASTGIQPVEDLLPIIAYHPRRYRLVANVNPWLHSPPAAEARRQLDLGAVAVKVHPVHGAFRVDRDDMYPVYDLCAEAGVPVIVHTGGSIFPGSLAEAGDPKLMDAIAGAYPGVQFVLAHGGRGRWYADAARMALARDNVWIDLAGLPPKRLPDYYAGFDLAALATKWIFGTDWPGVPGVAQNVRAVAALGLPDDTLADVLAGNAVRVYPTLTVP